MLQFEEWYIYHGHKYENSMVYVYIFGVKRNLQKKS
jgi:hypothetical protein